MGDIKLRTRRCTKDAIQVWCIGPRAITTPHQFWTTRLDGGNRVCVSCEKMIAAMRLSPMAENPMRDSGNE